MGKDRLELGTARDRFGFGTQKDEEGVAKSIQDSFLNILSGSAERLFSEGRLNEHDLRNVIDKTPMNIGANLGEYGMNLGINTPAPGRGGFTDDYRLTFSKRFQEGGEVNEIDWEFISEMEGGSQTEGYIPIKDDKVVG